MHNKTSSLDASIMQFAKVLYEELERDNWEDIDPWWVRSLTKFPDTNEPDDNDEDTEALRKVFRRTFSKLAADGWKLSV